jgi:site-specific recombinase XerD
VRASRNAVALYLDEQLRAVRQVTARHRLCSLRAFFRFCQAQGWRRDDPTQGIRIKQPKVQAQRPFTADEVRALLSACCNSRDRAIVLVLTATGIRVSELLGMTAADIDWERGMVLIRGKGSKERWVALGGIALEALREQANGEHGAIWRTVEGNPMPRVLVRDALYALSRRSGVAHVHAHRLRTTFANAWLMEGGDLQALQVLMGHSTIAQTAHYAAYSAASRALEAQRGFAFVDRLSGGDLKVLEAESAARWRCSICGGSERHAPGGCPAVPEEVRRLWASMGGQAKAQKTEASPC